ncbi:hypothetical protein LX32DRAFT_119267 [Colletotrichum zoysiae]|uniref:Uncharacterized protein n=1 Tax=Colletotrichum zoysiae TaxID=1216348 RepID=A0AAD9H7S4_9PEZI|nr:hypothetical protein LX32DRAFT_119267 [Colletotrichum zoysiae]
MACHRVLLFACRKDAFRASAIGDRPLLLLVPSSRRHSPFWAHDVPAERQSGPCRPRSSAGGATISSFLGRMCRVQAAFTLSRDLSALKRGLVPSNQTLPHAHVGYLPPARRGARLLVRAGGSSGNLNNIVSPAARCDVRSGRTSQRGVIY